MLKFESLNSTLKLRAVGVITAVVCLGLVVLASVSPVAAQDFTMQMDSFVPFAVNPGGEATSNVSLTGSNVTVDLSCVVTSQQVVTVYPVCTVSPTSVMPPGSASVTVTTNTPDGIATPGGYTVTVTGTSSTTTQTASQSVTVLAVTPQFTITVTSSVAPSSVHAGSGGQATISVNPINGYTGTVTLACASVTPVVTIPPVCTFTYPAGSIGVPVNGIPATATLTINTVGPPTKGAAVSGRVFYALWLPLPMLALLGLGAARGGRRSRKALSLLALFVLAGSLLLMPACGSNSSTTTTTTNGVTPNNTYTFTLSGVDANGVASSNTTTAPTVGLTVD
jgi:hypothetical protein